MGAHRARRDVRRGAGAVRGAGHRAGRRRLAALARRGAGRRRRGGDPRRRQPDRRPGAAGLAAALAAALRGRRRAAAVRARVAAQGRAAAPPPAGGVGAAGGGPRGGGEGRGARGPRPPAGGPDWRARVVAGKGVLLEGLEVVLIVAALAGGSQGAAPALVGAGLAVLLVLGIGLVVHRPLARVPESHLKYGVGVMLTSFGVFFLGEGLGVDWPGGDAALLYVAAAMLLASQVNVHRLARA